MTDHITEETYDALSAQWVELRDSSEGEFPNIEAMAQMFHAAGLRVVALKKVPSMWDEARYEVVEEFLIPREARP